LRYNIFWKSFIRRTLMANTFTAIMKQDGNWWIGWIEEVPGVNCQEKTREELLESLSVTLKEALEFNREEAIRAAAPDYTEESLIV
jgi:predicted RNase H-like HicB family nuclease